MGHSIAQHWQVHVSALDHWCWPPIDVGDGLPWITSGLALGATLQSLLEVTTPCLAGGNRSGVLPMAMEFLNFVRAQSVPQAQPVPAQDPSPGHLAAALVVGHLSRSSSGSSNASTKFSCEVPMSPRTLAVLGPLTDLSNREVQLRNSTPPALRAPSHATIDDPTSDFITSLIELQDSPGKELYSRTVVKEVRYFDSEDSFTVAVTRLADNSRPHNLLCNLLDVLRVLTNGQMTERVLKENKGAMPAHAPNAWPQTGDDGESKYDAEHNCIEMDRYTLSAEQCQPMMLVSMAYLHRALLVGKSEPCSPALQYGHRSAKAAAKGQGHTKAST